MMYILFRWCQPLVQPCLSNRTRSPLFAGDHVFDLFMYSSHAQLAIFLLILLTLYLGYKDILRIFVIITFYIALVTVSLVLL